MGHYAGSLGGLALASLLAEQNLLPAQAAAASPIGGAGAEPSGAHQRPKAKSVICLFQHGGPSQMDLFDPKPELQKYHGKPYPGGELEVHFATQRGNVLGSPFKFQPAGQCGMELSEILPHTAKIADDITLVRSMNTESVDHEAALRLIHTGKFLAGLPTWGAWVSYGLGSENRNLPSYVVLSDPGGLPVDGERNWSSGYLPAVLSGHDLSLGPVRRCSTCTRPRGSPPRLARTNCGCSIG